MTYLYDVISLWEYEVSSLHTELILAVNYSQVPALTAVTRVDTDRGRLTALTAGSRQLDRYRGI